MSLPASAAAEVRPPLNGALADGGADDAAVVAATALAAVATLAKGKEYWFSVACSSAFNIRFSADGTSTVDAPADTGTFQAGVHSFVLSEKNSHFRVTPVASGFITYWHSSRT